MNILRFSIQGMGFSNLAILAGVMEMFARMGVATLLVPAIGYTGACFASPAAWICADLFLIPASCWSIAHLRRVYGQPGSTLRASLQSHMLFTPLPDLSSSCCVRGRFSARLQKFAKGDCILVHSRL